MLTPLLSIIIVNFNGRELLRSCLESVYRETVGINFEILVVDNNSTDGSTEMLEDAFPAVQLIHNDGNVGFAKANNQAWLASCGEYIMLLNPDTVVLGNALAKLTAFLEGHPDAAACGPRLLNPDGSLQHSIGVFPTLLNQLGRIFFLHRLLPRFSTSGELMPARSLYQETRQVEWLLGAAILTRRQVLEEVGFLDEDFFLFAEEKDWCFRLKQAGRPIFFYPDAEIIHYGRGNNTSAPVFAQLTVGKLQFFRKHHSHYSYAVFRMITIVNVTLRAALWGSLRLLRLGDQKQARQRFANYKEAWAKIAWAGRLPGSGKGNDQI